MKLDIKKLKTSIEKNLTEFVGINTLTNSPHECNSVAFFDKWFKSVPYFQKNKDNFGFDKIENDVHGRQVPWCLLRGKGSKTVVLIHHSDTVNTQDYLKYQIPEDLALKPNKLMDFLNANQNNVLDNATERVKEDVKSGKWLFGRGVADMKGGAAVHMALIEQYAEDKNFEGNIIFLSLPDEENLSKGMLQAVKTLKRLKDLHNLDFVLTIDVESHERESDNKTIYYDGSIGKMMPLVYAQGKATHVGMIYGGLNPVALTSEIIRRTETSKDWIFTTKKSVSPPPTWLYSRDTKTEYEVTIPNASWAAMNLLTLLESPQVLMEKLKTTAEYAFGSVLRDLEDSYDTFYALNVERGNTVTDTRPSYKVNVKHYNEIYDEAVRVSGDAFKREHKKVVDSLKTSSKNSIENAVAIIEVTMKHTGDASPVIVLALVPPLYPCTGNKSADLGERGNAVTKVLDDAVDFTKKELKEDCRIKEYYNGISDLSYSMFPFEKEVADYIDKNMLRNKELYNLPLDIIKAVSMPVLNIGPWGRDIHKYTERVFISDLYEKTPLVTDFIIKKILL
ncbi:MAG: M20/M25/M40 family metallo-hydrolase [Firmicutes bacterium]|nr:M20/M25/M40 family metallo-hydrolase [Bacillota bacterium]